MKQISRAIGTAGWAVALVILTSVTAQAEEQSSAFEAAVASEPYYPISAAKRAKTLFQWNLATGARDDQDDAGEDTIVTDRPDFTEASSTVGKDRVQIETGYTFTRDKEGGTTVKVHSFPETLFRIGMLAEWFELRIAPNYSRERTDLPSGGRMTLRGAEDLYLGIKLALVQQDGYLPEMAIMPQMFVPSGNDDLSNDQVLPGVNWLYSWEINDCLSVGGSTQVNRVRDETGHFYVETAQSLTAAFSLTEKVGAYTEWFAFFPTSAVAADVGAEHFFNGGFTYLVNNNFQLDIRAGVGLNRRADDFFTGTGFSIRF